MKDSNNKLRVSHMNPIDVEKLDRIKRLMKFYDLSQTSLSERLGVMQSNVSAILNGKRPCGKSMDAKFLLAFPEIDKNWFLRGEGDMLKEGYTSFGPIAMASPAVSEDGEEPEAPAEPTNIGYRDQLIASLQDEIKHLREQLAVKDAMINNLISHLK